MVVNLTPELLAAIGKSARQRGMTPEALALEVLRDWFLPDLPPAILKRMLKPDKPAMSVAAAKAILRLGFDEAVKERMHELSAKAQKGVLTGREQDELNNFERIGHLLGTMQSKARRSLKNHR